MTRALGEGYALDSHSTARCVATAIDAAPSGVASVEDIVAAARSIAVLSKADLSRVRHNHGIGDDRAAVRFVVDEVIEDFVRRGQLVRDGNGGVSLKFRRVARLRYQDSRVPLNEPVEEGINKSPDGQELYGPFNKSFGDFKDGTREDLGDLTELTESMRAFGWIDAVGRALADEHGVVLAGRRRLEVAKRLGITRTNEGNPLTVTLPSFGEGNAADAERVKLALVSDLGRKPLTKPDRRKIAKRLYQDENWSMDDIAQALGVNQATVSRDLAEGAPAVSMQVHENGGSTKSPRKRSDSATDHQRKRIYELRLDRGLSREKTAAEVGLANTTVDRIAKKERERRASLEKPDPEPKAQGEAAMPDTETTTDPKAQPLEEQAEPETPESEGCPTCGKPWGTAVPDPGSQEGTINS